MKEIDLTPSWDVLKLTLVKFILTPLVTGLLIVVLLMDLKFTVLTVTSSKVDISSFPNGNLC